MPGHWPERPDMIPSGNPHLNTLWRKSSTPMQPEIPQLLMPNAHFTQLRVFGMLPGVRHASVQASVPPFAVVDSGKFFWGSAFRIHTGPCTNTKGRTCFERGICDNAVVLCPLACSERNFVSLAEGSPTP